MTTTTKSRKAAKATTTKVAATDVTAVVGDALTAVSDAVAETAKAAQEQALLDTKAAAVRTAVEHAVAGLTDLAVAQAQAMGSDTVVTALSDAMARFDAAIVAGATVKSLAEASKAAGHDITRPTVWKFSRCHRFLALGGAAPSFDPITTPSVAHLVRTAVDNAIRSGVTQEQVDGCITGTTASALAALSAAADAAAAAKAAAKAAASADEADEADGTGDADEADLDALLAGILPLLGKAIDLAKSLGVTAQQVEAFALIKTMAEEGWTADAAAAPTAE